MSTAMIWQTRSISSADTEKLGELLGKQLKGGEVIELRSDLGGGKTTFVRGLAKGAGSPANVTSPTFTLNRVYKAKNIAIHHYDFYRLEDAGIMADQLAESINQDGPVVVVEWANVTADVLPNQRLKIEFEPVANNPDGRQVTISYTKNYTGMIKQLEADWAETRP